jgi:hypothetical protein
MEHLKKELIEFKEMLVSNASVDFEFENNANEEFSELANQLQQLIDKFDRAYTIERLSHYVSEGDVEAALDKLDAHAEAGGGNDPADDVVLMWEPLEYRFTVDELISQVI